MSTSFAPFRRLIGAGVLASAVAAPAPAQLLPESGSFGLTLVYATSPTGTSQLQLLNPLGSPVVQDWGAPVAAVPSRWAHRRRTMGGLETEIAWPANKVWITPMGDAVGNGALHLVDARGSSVPVSVLVPTGNPAAYDLLVTQGLGFVFSAEDTGSGTTRLRGFSWATTGTLTPLTPAFLDLPGAPAAHVNRMGYDAAAQQLHVPTETGVQVLQLSASAPHVTTGAFISTLPETPTTNPASFQRNGQTTWIVGTANHTPGFGLEPLYGGWMAWTAGGLLAKDDFGAVPSVPTKNWVPAAGAEELSVVSNGTDTYVYYLLREPKPGVFFVKGSGVGVAKFLGAAAPTTGFVALSDAGGEPFGVPEVHGTRVAFETSFGPPFVLEPADGGERVCILYSPLDPVGAATTDGVIGIAAPLGGRISTKGNDRPIWGDDGSRVYAATSWFPGAPSVGLAGLEVLDVPAGFAVNEWTSPHTVVPTPDFPDQSIIFPGIFRPRDPVQAALWDGVDAVGHVAHDGTAAVFATGNAEIGQKQFEDPKFALPSGLPGFRSLLPATFDDVNGSLIPVPIDYGARRAAFNLIPGLSLTGLVMYSAYEDRVLLQPTGYETLAEIGLVPSVGRVDLALPAGWVTTSEFLSL